ncbi:hypothetical protein D6827_04140 [Candidatus Parcubacteria bacterium]|nr:MAG: hypothetical protein D6827_04140 [Candidatus Parcubacteria bacterium]
MTDIRIRIFDSNIRGPYKLKIEIKSGLDINYLYAKNIADAMQVLAIHFMSNDGIDRVISAWKKAGIVNHRQDYYNKPKLIKTIKQKISEYGVDNVVVAIDTYSKIVNNDGFWFNYRWPLDEFLQRGLQKFIDANAAFNNYAKNEHRNLISAISWMNTDEKK